MMCYPIGISKRYEMLPKRYTQEVYDVTQEVYPRGIRCYPRGMGRYPRGMNYTSWSASSYLLQCVFMPLALHMHTSWVTLCHPRGMDLVSPKRYVCSPRGMIIPLGLHSAYLLGCISYLLGNISIPLGLQPCTPRGMQKCTPRGIPKRYEMHSKRL